MAVNQERRRPTHGVTKVGSFLGSSEPAEGKSSRMV